MKKLRKSIALILAVATLCLLLASCGKSKTQGSGNSEVSATDQTNSAEDDSSKLSKDYRSGELQIEGEIVTLPMKMSDFMKSGWIVKYSSLEDGEMLEAKANDAGVWINYASLTLEKGEAKASLIVNNYTNQDIAVEDGYISEIDIEKCDVVIPGDFELGKATFDEIKAQWGKADYSSENKTGSSLSYYVDPDAEKTYKYFLSFDENNILESVKLENDNIDPSIASERKLDLINLDALQEIESKNSFELEIFSFEYSGNNNATIKIKNNTGEKITDVIILAVGYQENGELKGINSMFGGNYNAYNSDKYVKVVGLNKIGAGEILETSIPCSSVSGIKGIVYSYEDINGENVVNPVADEWVNNVQQ